MYNTYNVLLTKKYNKIFVRLAAIAVSNMAGLYGLLHLSMIPSICKERRFLKQK